MIIKKLMMVVVVLIIPNFVQGMGEVYNFTPVHEEGKVPEETISIGIFKDELERGYDQARVNVTNDWETSVVKKLETEAKLDFEKIKKAIQLKIELDQFGKTDKDSSINWGQLLSKDKNIFSLKESEKKDFFELINESIAENEKKKSVFFYINCISSAFDQGYYFIFYTLTLYLPNLKIDDQSVLDASRFSYVSKECVQGMVAVLIPEIYGNDSRNLKGKINTLQQLLSLIASRQGQFSVNGDKGAVVNDTLKNNKNQGSASELKTEKNLGESPEQSKSTMNTPEEAKENFKADLELIKKASSINLAEYLSQLLLPIKEDADKKKHALFAIFKDKPIKNYLDSIACAFDQKYPLIFNVLTIYLPFLKNKDGFKITDQLILDASSEFSYLSKECVQAMAALLIPETYTNDNNEVVSLKGTINTLQQLLFVIAFRQKGFPEATLEGGIYKQLPQRISDYLLWQRTHNTVIFLLNDNQLSEIPIDIARKSKTLDNLFKEGVEEVPNPSEKKGWEYSSLYQFSKSSFDIFWNIVRDPSINSLEQINKQNIEEILSLDIYCDVTPVEANINIQGVDKVPFYKLLAEIYSSVGKINSENLAEKKRKQIIEKVMNGFLYRTFVFYKEMSFVFPKEEIEGVDFGAMRFEKEVNLENYYLQCDVKKGNNTASFVWRQSLDEKWARYKKDSDESYIVDGLPPKTKNLEKNQYKQGGTHTVEIDVNGKKLNVWYVVHSVYGKIYSASIDCATFLGVDDIIKQVECVGDKYIVAVTKEQLLFFETSVANPFFAKTAYNHEISCFCINPKQSIFAAGSKKGIVEFFILSPASTGQKIIFIGSKNVINDLSEYNNKDRSVKHMAWSDDGIYFAVGVGDYGIVIYHDLLSKEYPQQKMPMLMNNNIQAPDNQLNKHDKQQSKVEKKAGISTWTKWLKPAAITGAMATGAWYIYNYLTKKPEPQPKEEGI